MPDRDSPYVIPDVLPGPVVENEEIQETIVVDPKVGDRVVLGTTIQTVTVDPVTGGRRFVSTTIRHRSDDQRFIDPSAELYSCACGKRLLTKHSVKFCAHCQDPVCFEHARVANDGKTIVDVCQRHYWSTFPLYLTLRFGRWLKKI